MAKFSVGERVKVVRLLDDITSRELIGLIGVIEEIDLIEIDGRIIQVNYYVDGHYMHEEELERVDNFERIPR